MAPLSLDLFTSRNLLPFMQQLMELKLAVGCRFTTKRDAFNLQSATRSKQGCSGRGHIELIDREPGGGGAEWYPQKNVPRTPTTSLGITDTRKH